MVAVTLAAAVDAVVCDLDGVVYAGREALPGAVDALLALECPVVYATNNASRAPEDVAGHLRELGLSLEVEDVLTSSVAGAAHLAELVEPGTPVLAVGGPGVGAALEAAGLRPSRQAADCLAVLQGYGPDVTASDLAEAAFAVQGGARWVATNEDRTLPTERGPAPGNGSLVAAVRAAVDVDPTVIGKPHAPMYLMAAERLGVDPERLLALGDRLETDIAGAHASGSLSALVLTGVHGLSDAAAAPPEARPTYVLRDLGGLHEPYPTGSREEGWWVRGDARARLLEGAVEVEGGDLDAGRAALDAVWHGVDVGDLTCDQARDLISRVLGRG